MRTGEFIILFSPILNTLKFFPDKNGFKNHEMQPKKYLKRNLWLNWNTNIQKEIVKNERPLCTQQISKSEKDKKYKPFSHWWECEANGTLINCWRKCKLVHLLLETSWYYLVQLMLYMSDHSPSNSTLLQT